MKLTKILIGLIILFILSAMNVGAAPILNMTFGDLMGTYNQTYNDTLRGTSGAMAGAINFSYSATDGIDLANPITTSPSTGTVNVWARVNSLSGFNSILGFTEDPGPRLSRFYIIIQNDYMQSCFQDNGVLDWCINFGLNGGIPDTGWHMLTVVQNGTQVNGYIDGVEMNRSMAVNSPNNSTWFDDYTLFPKVGFIGKFLTGGIGIDGDIDEITIYNRNLSTSEVVSLYQSGSPTSASIDIIPDSIGYYTSMDELYDFTGNGTNALTQGNITLTNVTHNNTGASFEFDGIDDYLDLGTSLSNICDNGCSVCHWLKPQDPIAGTANNIFTRWNIDGTDFLQTRLDATTFNYRFALGGNGYATGGQRSVSVANTTGIKGEWVHVCMVFNGSTTEIGNMSIYENGISIHEEEGIIINSSAWSSSPEPYYIGRQAARRYNGSINELLVYPRGLTASEVLQIYNPTGTIAPSFDTVDPATGATGISLTTNISLTVYDENLDNMTVNFTFDGTSACYFENVVNGTNVQCNLSTLNYNQLYEWSVEISDPSDTVQTSTFNFTTLSNFPPEFSDMTPANGTIDIDDQGTTLSIIVNDTELDNMSVNFTFLGVTQCSYTGVINGTQVNCTTPVLNNGTTYDWNVTINDAEGEVTTPTINFTTNFIPDILLFSPDQAIYQTQNILINFTSTDTNFDTLWYFNGTANVTYTAPETIVLNDSSYNLYFYVNDSFNKQNQTNFSFIIDTFTPSLIVHSPNESNYTTNNILINVTATDTFLDSIWYFNGTENVSYTTAILTPVPDGNHSFIFYANDTVNNINTTTVSFKVDTTGPVITIASPTNISYGTDTQLVNFSAVDINSDVDELWYNFNGTNTSYTTPIFQAFPEGSTTLIMYANDTLGNIGTNNVSFSIDTVSPVVNIIFPVTGNYSTLTLDLNYSTLANDKCWYDNGIVNSSPVTAGTNFSAQTATEGNNTWTLYCNNTLSNIGSDQVFFVTDTVAPSLTVHSPTESARFNNGSVLINFTATDVNPVTQWYWNTTDNVTYVGETYENLTDGDWSFIFYANDTSGNLNQTTINFSIDTVNPVINIFSPSSNNDTTGTNATSIVFNMTFTDSNLFGYNITCVGNGTEYSNQTIDLNVTTLNFYDTHLFTQAGQKNCTVSISDDHTRNNFNPKVEIKRPILGFGDHHLLINDEIEIAFDKKNKDRIDTLTYEKKNDRISPIFTLRNPDINKKTDFKITIRFHGTVIDRSTKYPGHIVIIPEGKGMKDAYWFDVMNDYDNAEIKKVKIKERDGLNKIEYTITIPKGELKDKKLKLKSIGGLNIVNQSFNFEIVSGQTVNVSGYDILTNVTVPINVSLRNGSLEEVNYSTDSSLLFDLQCGTTYIINITTENYTNNHFESFDGCAYNNISVGFYKSQIQLTVRNIIALTPVTGATINITQIGAEELKLYFVNTENITSVALYPGNYTINVSKTGFSSTNSTFNLTLSENKDIIIDLVPIFTTLFYREQDGSEFNFVESTVPYQCENGSQLTVNFTTQYTPSSYTCGEGWDTINDCDSSMDGLSETFGQSNQTASAEVNFWFNKPINSENISLFYIRKDIVQPDIINMTNFQSCWDQSQLMFKAVSNRSNSTLEMKCYNGTAYQPIITYNNGGPLYRAYMTWVTPTNETLYSSCDNETNIFVDVDVYCNDTVLTYQVDNDNREVVGVDCQWDYWLFRARYSTATYYRTLIPPYDEIQSNVYLLDLNLDEAIEVILKINDIANQYTVGVGQVKIYKFVNETRVVVIQQIIDIEKRAVLWLDKFETYELCTIDDNGLETCHGNLIADAAGEKIITLPQLDFVTPTGYAGDNIWWYYTGNKGSGTATLTYIDQTTSGYNQLEWLIKNSEGTIVSNEIRMDLKDTTITVTGLSQYEDYYTFLTVDHKDVTEIKEKRPLWFKSFASFPGFSTESGDVFKIIIAVLVPIFILLIFSAATAEVGQVIALVLAYVFNYYDWYALLTTGNGISSNWINVVLTIMSILTFMLWKRKSRRKQ